MMTFKTFVLALILSFGLPWLMLVVVPFGKMRNVEPVYFTAEEDGLDEVYVPRRSGRIADGAQVRVFNDLDEFQVMAKVAPTLRKGQLMMYHAWENFQFKNGKGFQNLMPVPMNPVDLAGGQFHLRPMILSMQPNMTDRETRVEVELA